jgi:phosphopantothenate-cysteine ligase
VSAAAKLVRLIYPHSLLSFRVRYLDNFSAGTRGATSAEYFLSAGYAVIFMHRQHSLSPYTRHYSHTTNPFLDLLCDPSEPGSGEIGHEQKEIIVSSKYIDALRPVLRDYDRARRAGTLLRLTFVTVNDYLFLLREMSRIMQPLGRSGMYYLAAAVSDFYVPSQKTVSWQAA